MDRVLGVGCDEVGERPADPDMNEHREEHKRQRGVGHAVLYSSLDPYHELSCGWFGEYSVVRVVCHTRVLELSMKRAGEHQFNISLNCAP